jgi:uncharacterized protein (DUF2062 family)
MTVLVLLEWLALMPRAFLKRFIPHAHTLRDRWYLRPFGTRLWDPRLWSLQRRAVTGAFGAGLAICFVPLPVHLPVAALCAIVWRLNVPTVFATVFIVNPLTALPIYYAAYRTGAAALGLPVRHFAFHPSWEWLQHGLGPAWKPFLVGCLICSIVAGFCGRFTLELLWRARVRSRYRNRKGASLG